MRDIFGIEKQKAGVETHLSFFYRVDRLNGVIVPDRPTERNRIFRRNFYRYWLDAEHLLCRSFFFFFNRYYQTIDSESILLRNLNDIARARAHCNLIVNDGHIQ